MIGFLLLSRKLPLSHANPPPLSLHVPVMWQGAGRGMLNSSGLFCLQEAQVLSSDGELLVGCVYLVK